MIFLSNKNEVKSYTMIHNVFFEQIMPRLEDKYIKVYMYGYYLAMNIEQLGAKNSHDIANEIFLEYEQVLSAWDYLEKCNLIRKHYVENSTSDNYSIEFLPISKYKVYKETGYEEEVLNETNQNLREMYDKIEDITKLHLNPYDIKKIDTFIRNQDISYELVVEAFEFVYYQKKSGSVKETLDTLKTWIKDGIYTSRDLEENLFSINEQYATYRKILRYFGEYRLPTKPEMKMMDKWINEYLFSIEVIEKAIDETLKIKAPNFKYLDKVVENWHEIYARNQKTEKKGRKEFLQYKEEVFQGLGKHKNITADEEKKILFLYRNYPKDTVESAIKHIKAKKQQVSIDSIFALITGGRYDDTLSKETIVSFGNIKWTDIQALLEKNKASYLKERGERQKKEKVLTQKERVVQVGEDYVKTPSLTGEELEEKMLARNDLKEFLKK